VKAPRWGTLDIKLGDLNLPKPRAANVTAPLDPAALSQQLDLAVGAHVAHAETRPLGARHDASPIAARGEASRREPTEATAKRAESGPLATGARANSPRRADSAKLEPAAPRARRAHEGPTRPLETRVAAPRHPALGHAEAQHPALRGSSPRTRAASRPISSPLDRPQESSADATTFGERFGDDSPLEIGSALEIESESVAREPEASAPIARPTITSKPAPPPSAATQLAELSGYGAPPQKLFQTVPYFFRVSSRKRLLRAQLSAQSLQRKRSELRADDAQTAMGEALYALRDDRRLQPLAAQLKLVHEARDQIGRNNLAAKRTIQTRKREFEALSQRLAEAKRAAAPFRDRASTLGQQIELGKAKLRDLDKQSRKLESERRALKGSSQVAALSQIATLDDERAALLATIQSVELELAPAIEASTEVEKTIVEHDQVIARLEEQQRKTAEAAERDSDRQRITARSAANAYRETLRSLAQAAVRSGLGELAAPALRNASEAEAPIADERQSEEMLRRALASYDHAAYRRGMQIVAGGIVGTFMFFAVLIAF
jgi:hypothetical protein